MTTSEYMVRARRDVPVNAGGPQERALRHAEGPDHWRLPDTTPGSWFDRERRAGVDSRVTAAAVEKAIAQFPEWQARWPRGASDLFLNLASHEDTYLIWYRRGPSSAWVRLDPSEVSTGVATVGDAVTTKPVRAKAGPPILEERPDTQRRVDDFWRYNDDGLSDKEIALKMDWLAVRTVYRWRRRFARDK